MGRRLDNVMELAGLALLVSFAYAVWPPAALLAGGAFLVLGANARTARRRRRDAAATAAAEGRPAHRAPTTLDRILTAVTAYRAGAK